MNEPPDAALITSLLHEWRDGRHGAFERLVPLVYGELRAIAARQLTREWRHDHLQITLIEPGLIIVVGLFVAMIVLSLLSAIVGINAAFS